MYLKRFMDKRKIILILIDSISILASLVVAFYLRFDFLIPNKYFVLLYMWTPVLVIVQLIIFISSEMYNRIWKFTSLSDLFAIIKYIAFSTLLAFFMIFSFLGVVEYPKSVLLLYLIINTLVVCASRVIVRLYYSHVLNKLDYNENIKEQKRVIILGAGGTGEKIAREIINRSFRSYKLIGFVDDDNKKLGSRIHGFKVLGKVSSLQNLTDLFDEVLICAPSASGNKMRAIIDICMKLEKDYKTVPTFSEMLAKDITLDSVREVSYVDLLGRKEIKLNTKLINKFLKGKRILITGAGGSIGSEIVRQCLLFNPSEIICIEISEEKIFKIGSLNNFGKNDLIVKTVLVDIINYKQLEKAFNENRPQIVIHAAAYKHVPIQELHPWTAVNTNVIGTLNIVELSDKYRVEKFVLVSTDKAVNPVNVMGATKRVAEKLIQSFNITSNTNFLAVRFGNVLGSSGSAIPIFQDQINKGGPVTITHPEMNRYFMSIPEASQLILQCGSFGKDGEIFLLDMGKPIKIYNIASDLIKLSGYEPEIDIPIVYTGLRPGEKLYEELKHTGEVKVQTNHKKIVILKDGKPVKLWNEFKKDIQDLLKITDNLDSIEIQSKLKELIPTYQPRELLSKNKIESDLNSYEIKGEA
jgi:FlaA1/EpsC-like NDP-sugar epimerase